MKIMSRETILKIFILSGFFLFLGGECYKINKPNNFSFQSMNKFETVQFQTPDGVIIKGDYLASPSPKAYLLLLHMMPATRTSWYPLMDKLRTAGYASLAIDLRGHGESLKKKTERGDFQTLNYKNFSEAEHQATIQDVEAAVKWLIEEKGASKSKIAIIGASIGANLALEYLSENPEVETAILLSPGLDYRGIKTEPLALKINPKQAIFLVASEDDSYSFETNRILYNLLKSKKEIKEFKKAGHGTTMLERESSLMDELIEWLDSLFNQ
jgi:pimeloyl-ACP methyl ester carboxylesterase